jgi:quaternary ammonium compound-resistance protein SugE
MLDFKKITAIRLSTLTNDVSQVQPILPLLGYIVFGLGNIYFFSLAMREIPASTAFAVWMALALVFTKVIDVAVFQQPYNMQQVIFTLVILIGIAGLKYYEV